MKSAGPERLSRRSSSGWNLYVPDAGFPEEPAGYWTVDHVAVIPEYRANGFGVRVLGKRRSFRG
jgi:hypothetical protein